ncbi:hypothetical protein F9228_24885 [Vibrio parahaemolyticus]|nr:hypothetical protein [Vibrio parahaemolyticus]EGQ9589519.1 hypothetical protein [Vibrio parahaemolyticus]EGR1003114.1 hypothetical protein [Vibrio parahaemolyticus]EGR1304326.1 hypothetical protein [Vibrio parahaemolyticus]EGR1335596.1 hypothetical protein [Vibrio parahaemolyticus]
MVPKQARANVNANIPIALFKNLAHCLNCFSTRSKYSSFITYSVIFTPSHNAALRGEQRIPPKLNHCAVNTKAD